MWYGGGMTRRYSGRHRSSRPLLWIAGAVAVANILAYTILETFR